MKRKRALVETRKIEKSVTPALRSVSQHFSRSFIPHRDSCFYRAIAEFSIFPSLKELPLFVLLWDFLEFPLQSLELTSRLLTRRDPIKKSVMSWVFLNFDQFLPTTSHFEVLIPLVFSEADVARTLICI